jgi:hypothetical protein
MSLGSGSVKDVCLWMSKLELSKDYSSLLEENAIDGSTLQRMTNEDFHLLGIRMGDRMKIKSELKTVIKE